MKICIPTKKDCESNEVISDEFETTSSYMIHDTESTASAVLSEQQLMSTFNADNSLDALIKAGVQSIITPVIRSAAFVVLKKRTDIQLFTSVSNDITENIDLFNKMKLRELTQDSLVFTMGCAGQCTSCSITTCK